MIQKDEPVEVFIAMEKACQEAPIKVEQGYASEDDSREQFD